jgi:hypothetical protein
MFSPPILFAAHFGTALFPVLAGIVQLRIHSQLEPSE